MNKLLLILLLLPCLVKAQVKTKLYVGGPLASNVYRGPLGSDSALYIMSGCDSPIVNLNGFYGVYRGALIYKDTCNDRLWTSNPDETWSPILSGGDTNFITVEGDTVIINNIKIKNRFRVPLTDTTNAIKGCGNIIYDTILNHYFGDDCFSGVHGYWACFDCDNFYKVIDTTVVLDGTVLQLTIPHGVGADPSQILVLVDNEQGLTTFVQPYFDATNIYIPYSIGPICTCTYQIRIWRQ